jgi:protein involved in polysaccharide export with SLBB domain
VPILSYLKFRSTGIFCLTILIIFTISSRAQDVDAIDLVHYGDVIEVDVLGGFEFDWRGTLTPAGYLDGVDGFNEQVLALCRSEKQIAADVERAFSRILRDPKVVVKILDRSRREPAIVDGAVRTPTRFKLRRAASLAELIVLAGGFTDLASGEVTIFRQKNAGCDAPLGPENNSLSTRTIKISELIAGIPIANPRIVDGDLITVGKASPVYVIGAVANPGPISIRGLLTLERAIASAGGLAKGADASRVSIFRRNGADTEVIEVSFEKGRSSLDTNLRAFDIIDVAARGGGKRKFPPVAAPGNNSDRVGEVPIRIVE